MKRFIEIFGNGAQYILTVAQTNEVFQLVELILSILTTLFILGINIYAWYKKSKKDGKIDEEELEELKNIVDDGVNELKDKEKNNKL